MKNNKKPYIITIFFVFLFLFVIRPTGDSTNSSTFAKYRGNKSDVVMQVSTKAALQKDNKKKVSGFRTPASVTTEALESEQTRPYERMKKMKLFRKVQANQIVAKEGSYKYNSLAPQVGTAFETNGQNYKLLYGFYAIKATEENASRYPASAKKLGHYIIKSVTPIEDALPVVENADTGHVGVFTGVIKVKLKSMDVAEKILDIPYSINDSFEYIKVVMYQFSSYEDTLNSLETFKAHPEVERANIEVLEFQRSKR